MARPRITLTFVVAGLASGCALTGTSVPPLAGPSELGLSLSIAAAPDVLVENGLSRSRVTVTARDASARPVYARWRSLSTSKETISPSTQVA